MKRSRKSGHAVAMSCALRYVLQSCLIGRAFTTIVAGVLGALCAAPASAQVLSVHTGSVTTYMPSGATSGQDVRAQVNQRGVHIDGSLRSGAMQMVGLGANPFEPGSGTSRRLGDLDLATGAYAPTSVDLALPAPGASRWTIGRSFNHLQRTSGAALRNSDGPQGFNWFQMSQPEIVVHDPAGDADDAVYLVYGADRFAEFVKTGSGSVIYTGRNGAGGIFEYVSGSPDTWVYNDPSGVKLYFFGGNTSSNRASYQFWKVVDEAGNAAFVGDKTTASTATTSGYNTDKTINVAYDGISGDGRRYSYSYTSIGGRNRLTQVSVETKGSGTWSSPSGVVEVARVIYDYYTADGDSHGMAGDLKVVTVRTALSDSGSSMGSGIYLEKETYYRYYDDTWSNSDGRRGSPHQIKMVLEPEGTRRYDADQETPPVLDDDYLTASDANLKPYSSAYLEFVSSGDDRVAGGFFDGACGCSGGINSTYTMVYGTNGSFSPTSGYDTDWKDRAVVTQPDAIWFTQYFDETGQPLARVITDADPAGSPTDMWATEIVRDSSGRVTQVRTPAANTGYTHSTGALTANSSVGLIHVYARVSGGSTDGFFERATWKEGTSGTAYQTAFRSYGTVTRSVGAGTLVRPYVSGGAGYKTQITGTGTTVTDYDETTHSNTAHSSTVAFKRATATSPAVVTGENGSNSATTGDRYTRSDGTTAFTRAADDVYTYTQYTNGLAVKQIADCQTNHGSDFAAGDDPNTDFGVTENGNGLRLITSYTHDSMGRVASTTLPSGRVTRTYYSRLADGRMVALSFPRETSGPPTYYGPASYTVINHAGKPEFTGTVAISSSGSTTALTSWIDETDTDPITALDTGTLARMGTTVYSKQGTRAEEARAYHDIPASGAGSDGTNYDATLFGFDDMGRQRRTKDATGTITRTAFDDLGRTYRRYIGTNDSTFPGGESSGTDTMVKIEELQYDGNADGGNSYLTQRTAYVENSTTDQRITTFTNDARGRTLLVTNPKSPHILNACDNLGRMTASGLYSSTASITVGTDVPTSETTNRLGLSETYYDARGQVWKTIRHKIDDADGSDDDTLLTSNWYDAAGRPIKTDGEQLAKTIYDRLGRTTRRYVLTSDNDTGYADADDVTGDTVLEEHVTMIESSTSNTLAQIAILRHYSDTSTTGALDTNADADDLTLTAANVTGRVSITSMWYDSIDRPNDNVAYGTNAIVGDGSTSTGTFSRSGLSVPARSDTALRTTTAYNNDGSVQSVTDPRALVAAYVYDDLGRQVTEIRNYTGGSTSTAIRDNDLYTRRVYTDGLMTQLWLDLDADNVQDADDQVTIYTYGVTKGSGASDSKISSGRLLLSTQYPDSSGGSDVVAHAYNAQGQEKYRKDQLGGIIETVFDTGGRVTHKRVTTLGTNLDGAVRRVSMTYTSRGQVATVTQYDNATVGSGSAVDEVKYAYDDWGPLSTIEQDFNGTVGGGGDDKDVSFAYAKNTGGRNTVRRTSVTIPGQTVDYDYDSASSINDNSSRVYRVKLGGTTVAEYGYTGAGMLVRTTLSQPTVFNQAYAVGAATGVYDNLDRFNRVEDDLWVADLSTDRNFIDLDVTYDRNSNITSVTDVILKNPAGTRQFDAKYTMDNLDRVTVAAEGNYSAGNITTATRGDQWTLTQTGNWDNNKLNLNGDADYTDSGEWDADATFNNANEMATSDNYAGLTYDANGNLTDEGTGNYDYVYDAWNRLRFVKTQAGATVAEYRYNGINHRIAWHYDIDADADTDSNDNWIYFVHDDRWRIVATYRGNGAGSSVDSNPKERFVFHAAGTGGNGGSSYIDSVIVRDRDNTSGWNSSSDNVLEERRYYIQNVRADVIAIIKDSRAMVERIKYSAYGVPFNLPMGDTDCDGDTDATDVTQINNWIGLGYQALGDTDLDGDVDLNDKNNADGNKITTGRSTLSHSGVRSRLGYAGYQAASELVRSKWHVRNRVFTSDSGRWNTRDPLGYSDGPSLYQYGHGWPIRANDPMGTTSQVVPPPPPGIQVPRNSPNCYFDCQQLCAPAADDSPCMVGCLYGCSYDGNPGGMGPPSEPDCEGWCDARYTRNTEQWRTCYAYCSGKDRGMCSNGLPAKLIRTVCATATSETSPKHYCLTPYVRGEGCGGSCHIQECVATIYTTTCNDTYMCGTTIITVTRTSIAVGAEICEPHGGAQEWINGECHCCTWTRRQAPVCVPMTPVWHELPGDERGRRTIPRPEGGAPTTGQGCSSYARCSQGGQAQH